MKGETFRINNLKVKMEGKGSGHGPTSEHSIGETDLTSVKVHAPPGGHSSFSLGGDYPPAEAPKPAAAVPLMEEKKEEKKEEKPKGAVPPGGHSSISFG